MKLIKKTALILLGIIGVFLMILVTLILLEKRDTSYLNIEKNKNSESNSVLIKNVNIIPMTSDTVLMDKMILIKNGIISAIDDSINSNGTKILDAGDRYLSPGLIDMHVHVWDKYELGLYLSYGITTVRNLWGMPMHLRLKEEIDNEEIFSPMFFTSGPKLTGPEFIGDDNLNLFSSKETREKIIEYHNDGYDFIKSYYGLTKDIFDAIIEQATKYNIDIVAHPSQKVPFSFHFKPQIKSIEHAEDIVQEGLNYKLDSLKLQNIIQEFKDSPNTSFCPTLISYYNIYKMLTDERILTSSSAFLMNALIRKTDSQDQFARWQRTKKQDPNIVSSIKKQHDFHLKIVKRFNNADINIICGTDAGIGMTAPGYSIQQELELYKEAGLSNYDVLKTATANASKVHKQMNNLGTIEVGKIANLLILENNPLNKLESLHHPLKVFIRGRKINREQLNDFQIKAKNRSNLLTTALRYAEYYLFVK